MCDWPALRVVHVNDVAFVASTLADAQRRRGASASVVHPATPLAAMPYPWKVATFPLRGIPLVAAAIRLRRADRPIIHVHYATSGITAILSRRPFAIHCHGSDVRGLRIGSLRTRYLAWVLKRASLVLYATPDLAADVLRLRTDAVFLPNPIDVATFSPGPGGNRDVLLASRLNTIKGTEVAVAGLVRFLEQRPAAKVTVVAAGLRVAWARAALGDRVEWVRPVQHGAMPDLMRAHRVVLGQFKLGILSQLELEALACGVPVITDFAFDSVYSSAPPLTQASTAMEVANALVRLHDDELSRARLGAESRDWVVRNHNALTVVDRLCSSYVAAGLVSAEPRERAGSRSKSRIHHSDGPPAGPPP